MHQTKGVLVIFMNKKRIDRAILNYLLEIFIVIIMVIISYFVFTNTHLSETAAIAEKYDNANYNIQMTYGKTEETENAILAYANLIDRGVLSIRNPNNSNKRVELDLIFNGDPIYLNYIEAEYNGEKIDLKNHTENNGRFIVRLDSIELSSYQEINHIFSLYGDASIGSYFTISFECKESFYM